MPGFVSLVKRVLGRRPPSEAENLKERGNAWLSQGKFDEAADCYRQAIAADAGYAEAHNNLGFAYSRLGRLEEAESAYRSALALDSDLGAAQLNLGSLLAARGAFDEAFDCCERARRLLPPSVDLYAKLGEILYARGDHERAIALLNQALEAGLDVALIHFNIGICQRELKRFIEAEGSFRRVLALEPENALAHYELALIFKQEGMMDAAEQTFLAALAHRPDFADARVNLGLLLAQAGRLAEAEAAYHEALTTHADHVEALNNLGILLMDAGRYDEAERRFRRAVELRPDMTDCRCNLGYVQQKAMRYPEAERTYLDILRDRPDEYKVRGNLGYLYADWHRFGEAEQAFRHALSLAPDYAEARRDLGYTLLSLGRYAEGWPLHEARYDPRLSDKKTLVPTPQVPFPQWRGESLRGKSLLVCYEQGFGDEIQFARFIAVLKRCGASRVGLICTEPLRELFGTLEGVDALYTVKSADLIEPYDYWVLAMSIPLHLCTTLETIPTDIPYLSAGEQRLARWRDRLPREGLRVGVVWKGNPKHKNDAHRSLPNLGTLAPLWDVPGVAFVSLQKGSGEDEARMPPEKQPLVDLGSHMQNFADAAAIVSQLDVVICIDTAIAHLAGALGKACWVLLPRTGTDWRWLQERTDSPWYPGTLRLFRQATTDEWAPVVEEVAQALRSRLSGKGDRDNAMAWKEEGNKHFAKRNFAEAERCYRRAVQLDPAYGEALNNLGYTLKELGRPAEAERALIDAAAAAPDLPEVPKNLGDLYRSQRDFEKAEQAYRQCMALVPERADAINNLGVLLNQRGRFDEAEGLYRAAMERDPALVAPVDNLCTLLTECERVEEAEDIYRGFVAAHPTDVNGRFLFSLFLLRIGKFAEGWVLHETRYDAAVADPVKPLPTVPYPQWRGEPLNGKSMLVWYEQGFGDEIQFGRYVAELKKRGARRVDLVCKPQLRRLFGGLKDVDEVYAAAPGLDLPHFDFWTLPMSLPLHCRTALETIPASLPYLSVPGDLLARWRASLPVGGLRVGLVWKGNPRHHNDVNRSLPGLAALAPLWRVGAARFFSLQKQAGEDEALAPPPGQPLVHLGADIEDFADMAAVVAELDLVICVDTAVAHLAGALAKPCWLLLPYTGADWRWLRDCTNSPWYPGVMRLFRQRAPGDWATVIGEVATALADLASTR